MKTQGSKPRTQKNPRLRTALPNGRPSRGQGQECSRTRIKDTNASVLKKKRGGGFQKIFSGDLKKKTFKNFFQAIATKIDLEKNFQAIYKILTIQKIVLSSSRGQGNFRRLEAKAKDFKICPRGLHLWYLHTVTYLTAMLA